MDFATLIWAAAFLVPLCAGQGAEQANFEVKMSPSGTSFVYNIDSSKVFRCLVTTEALGEQVPTLTWFKDDVEISGPQGDNSEVLEQQKNTRVLRINKLTEESRGTYKCEGVLGAQKASASFTVELYQSIEFKSEYEQFGIVGQDGMVECKAVGSPPPERVWTFENKTVIDNSDKYVKQDENLIIKGLTFADAMTYNCELNEFTQGQYKLNRINFEVVELPKITNDPTINPNNAKVGDKVEIVCQATGVPAPTYQWKRGDQIITSSEEETIDEINGVLTLKSITRQSEAEYTCTATNKGGYESKSTTLDVLIPPTIKDIPDVPFASEEQQLDVLCEAEGDPAPTIIWQKVGQEAYAEDNVDGPQIVAQPGDDLDTAEIKRVGKIMRFSALRPEDAGNYMCKAISNVGTVNKTVKIEVQFKPHFNVDYKESVFYGWKGHKANLTCMASANGLATFTWYIPSTDAPEDVTQAEQISQNAIFELPTQQMFPEYHLSSSSLIVHVTGDDSSLYRDYLCEAHNGQAATRTVTLREATAPDMPTLKVTKTKSTMVELQVSKPSKDGGQPVKGYSYSYYRSGDEASKEEGTISEEDSQGDSTTFEVSNLAPSTSYVVKIAAINNVGVGQDLRISLKTKEVSKPEMLSLLSNVQGADATSYTVQWGQPQDGGSAITKFIIKYQQVKVTDSENPTEWQIVDYVGAEVKRTLENKPDARSYKLAGLESNTYYDLRISAVNGIGESDATQRIIKTGAVLGEQKGKKEEKKEGGIEGEGEVGAAVDKKDQGNATTPAVSASAGMDLGVIIGIIVGIIVLILIIVIIIVLVSRKNPQMAGRFRLGGKGGEVEGGAKEDGKNQAEEEKLIQKEDTMKLENETEGTGSGNNGGAVEDGGKPEEYEPDTKPVVTENADATPAPETAATDAEPEKAPAPVAEIKVTPETPDKPENPTA